MKVLLQIVTLLAIVSVSLADYGSCRYDSDRCSCKLGAANEGICWDKILGETNQCAKRFCRSGWTCACGERTHVCYRSNKAANILKNPSDITKDTAECKSTAVPMVSGRQFTLGTLKLFFSRNGMLVNDCTNIAWWLDGELLGNRKTVDGMSETIVNSEMTAREEHSLLEILPGSLVAFRIKGGSYYCFKHYAEMVVNTTSISTQTAGVTVHYAREYSANWFMPSYKLSPANTASDESEADLKKFIPLREKKMASDIEIVPGNDYWQPIDSSSADNKRSNWYYRIQIPEVMPTITGL